MLLLVMGGNYLLMFLTLVVTVLNFSVYAQSDHSASFESTPYDLVNAVNARNIATGGGQLEAAGKNISVDPTGEFKNESEIGNVLINSNPHCTSFLCSASIRRRSIPTRLFSIRLLGLRLVSQM